MANKDYYVQRFIEVKDEWGIDSTAAAMIVLAEAIVDAASNIGCSINRNDAAPSIGEAIVMFSDMIERKF